MKIRIILYLITLVISCIQINLLYTEVSEIDRKLREKMNKQLYIIANVKAGSGSGKNRLEETKEVLRNYNLPFITRETEYPGHALDIVKQIIHKAIDLSQTDIIVVGGDGTLHEVVSALLSHQVTLPITYIPAGTGNDFSRTWHNTHKIKELIENYLYKRNLQMIPIFKTHNAVTNEEGIILNSLGFGIDGTIMKGIKAIPENSFFKTFANGKFSYAAGIIQNVTKLNNFKATLIIDDQPLIIDNCQFISFMNSPYLGGGIRLANDVQPLANDISIIIFKDVKIPQLLQLLWQIIVTKATPSNKYFLHLKGQSIKIVIEQIVDSQVDGEIRRLHPTNMTLSITQYPFYL